MNRVESVLTCCLLLMLLSACERSMVRDESSPLYSIPAGSTLVLNTSLTIAPDHVSVYFQDGSQLDEQLLERYRPYCKFEIRTMQEYARQVQADSFLIESVYDSIEQVSLDGVRYARLWHASDMPAVYTYTTYLELVSPRQPDVLRMSCMHWESVLDDNFLSIEQMRRAMGDVFTLELADDSLR